MALKNFKTPDRPPTFAGGIGDGGPMDHFHETWKMKRVVPGCWVIGKKVDDGKGCFSVQELGSNYDIAFYQDCAVTEIWDSIKNHKGLHAANAMHFDSDPRNKYLALDLIKILKDHDLI